MTDVIVRWAGPADATSGSTYKVEYTLNNTSWTTAEAAQAATAPYASDTTTLAANVTRGATTMALTDAASFASAGYLWLDDALVQWTGKSVNNLTGVRWHSGYGTYASGSTVYEAHESKAVTGLTISLNAVLFRVTHTDADGAASAPTYIWYYSPPTPASSDHCVVIVNLATDLGLEAQSGVSVTGQLAADTEFSDRAGLHLDSGQSAAKTATTNAFGLAFFHCWKSSRRAPLTGSDAAYTFVLDSGDTAAKLTVTVDTIPDQDWALLSQIATAAE